MIKTLLAAIALASVLAACGNDASKKGPAPAPSTTTPATPTPTPPPAEKKVEPKK